MKSEDQLVDGFTGKLIVPQPLNPFAESEGKCEGITYTTIVLDLKT